MRDALRGPGTFLVLCGMLVTARAAASPLALPDRAVAPAPRIASDRLWPTADGPIGVCGTRMEAVTDALTAHAQRAACVPLPTLYSRDVNGIAVLEDDGTLFFMDNLGHTVLDIIGACQMFNRTHGDDYDFIAFYLSSGLNSWLGSPGALAAAFPLRNDTQGIGLDLFDFGSVAGSAARLRVPLSMNGLHRYPANPDQNFSAGDAFNAVKVLAHEMGHRWLAYVFVDSAGIPVPALLGRDYAHWNFFADVDSSIMEGCDWTSPAPDSFVTDGVIGGYGRLDQYLMGLRSKSEIDSFFVVNDPSSFDPPGIYVPYSIPKVGIGCRGRATSWHISDIEAVHGPRIPDAASSPHAFRMAVVLVTAHGTDVTAADLTKLGALRARIVSYFSEATQGRGTIDVSLDSHAGSVEITHEPLPDTEDSFAARPIGAHVRIAQAGIPLSVDPASVRAYWRSDSTGPFTPIPLASVAADSFAGSLPAQPAGTRVEYYLHASSDSSGIEAYNPPGGAAVPHVYFVGIDMIPPRVVHVPIATHLSYLMPRTFLARVTDNLGVDSVWFEGSKDGGLLETLPTAPVGRDSFQVSFGIYSPVGTRIAYRFVARDRATVPNIGYSNAAFDTLVSGRDLHEEFENGPDTWTHREGTSGYRDLWHLTQEWSSPAGGSGWKCGACGDAPYPPHLDGVLISPSFEVEPGSMLRFDHRYDLEEADSVGAWDGARVELQALGDWEILTPAGGYTHKVLGNSNRLGKNTPCWSGRSTTWRSEVMDLSPWAGNVAHFRFRMAADDFLGYGGWFVDHVQITNPSGAVTTVGRSSLRLSIGNPWPNPARDRLRLSVVFPRSARSDWALFDLAGRRVAQLWRGVAPAGPSTLEAPLPAGLTSGLYFARLSVNAHTVALARVAVVR